MPNDEARMSKATTIQGESINRRHLESLLVRAAMVRSAITLSAVVAAVIVAALLSTYFKIQLHPSALIFVFFGIPLVVSWLTTLLICRRMVACARCRGSLWESGSGNFKPRRMRLRDDAHGCPRCGIPFR